MGPGEASASFFCKRNVISLGNVIISKIFTLLTYFSRETAKVLGKFQFLKSHISCRISITNSLYTKHISPALAGSLVNF